MIEASTKVLAFCHCGHALCDDPTGGHALRSTGQKEKDARLREAAGVGSIRRHQRALKTQRGRRRAVRPQARSFDQTENFLARPSGRRLSYSSNGWWIQGLLGSIST